MKTDTFLRVQTPPLVVEYAHAYMVAHGLRRRGSGVTGLAFVNSLSTQLVLNRTRISTCDVIQSHYTTQYIAVAVVLASRSASVPVRIECMFAKTARPLQPNNAQSISGMGQERNVVLRLSTCH